MLHQPKQTLKTLKRFDAQNNWRLYAESEEALYEGDFYPSVTTVLDLIVDHSGKELMLGLTKDKYDSMMDRTAANGTLLHDAIACDLDGKEFNPSDEILKELETSSAGAKSLIEEPLKKWAGLKQKEGISGVLSELGVYSELYGFAGTLDHILRERDFLCVGELKTGKFRIQAGWQACTYFMAYQELYDVTEEMGVRGIQIHRNGATVNYFRYKQLLNCFEAFLSAYNCWRMSYFNELSKMRWKYLFKSPIKTYMKNFSNYEQWHLSQEGE